MGANILEHARAKKKGLNKFCMFANIRVRRTGFGLAYTSVVALRILLGALDFLCRGVWGGCVCWGGEVSGADVGKNICVSYTPRLSKGVKLGIRKTILTCMVLAISQLPSTLIIPSPINNPNRKTHQ